MLALALIAACASPVTAQATPPVTKLRIESSAQHTLDSLANESRTNRVEIASCLSSYTVKGDSLILSRFSPADYLGADSVSVSVHVNWMRPEPEPVPACPLGVPVLHSHVAAGGYPFPSDRDMATKHYLGMWALLLSVGDSSWRIIVY